MKHKKIKIFSLSLLVVLLFLEGATGAFAVSKTKSSEQTILTKEKSSIPHTLSGDSALSERPDPSLFRTRAIRYFHPTTTINIRTAPSTKAAIVGQYYPGEVFAYDTRSLVAAETYNWVSYVSYSGYRRYVAVSRPHYESYGYDTAN